MWHNQKNIQEYEERYTVKIYKVMTVPVLVYKDVDL